MTDRTGFQHKAAAPATDFKAGKVYMQYFSLGLQRWNNATFCFVLVKKKNKKIQSLKKK